MLDNARFVRDFIRDKSHDDLVRQTAVRFAAERGLQNVGDAAFRIRRLAPDVLNAISESDRIIRMRHVLMHGYDEVQPSILWDVATNKLGALIEQLEHLTEPPSSTL